MMLPDDGRDYVSDNYDNDHGDIGSGPGGSEVMTRHTNTQMFATVVRLFLPFDHYLPCCH